jgi:hypothetical protein
MPRDFSASISRKVLVIGFALCMAFGISRPDLLLSPAHAQTRTCFNIMSGNGSEGSLDPQVEFSTDGGMTWQSAFIVPPNMDLPEFTYDVIPGTHYVSISADRSAPQNENFLFRISFTMPPTFVNPSISVQVHSDNAAAGFLNGNPIGAQNDVEDPANFKDPTEVFFSDNDAFFQAGANELRFDVHNFTNQLALDFKAEICFEQGCVDENPPSISCNVTQSVLWPPNHNLVTVGLTASVTDDCDADVVIGGGPNGTGVTVYSDEEDLEPTGAGKHSPDAKNMAVGTLRLRAEREGDDDGRVYLIVVQATDAAGNTGFCTRTVVVPHDQSKKSINAANAAAAAAKAFFMANGTPPPGFVQVGVGPIVGPKQ